MKSLGLKIIITVFIVTITSNVIIGRVVYSKVSLVLQDMMHQDLQHSIDAVANDMNLNKDKELKMLETLASNPSIRDRNVTLLEKTHIVYEAMKSDKDYLDVAILDMNGEAYINNGEKRISFAERDYFKEAAKGNIFITDPFVNKVTNQVAMFFSYPVKDYEGKIINVVFCVVDGYKLSELCELHPISNNRIPYVISAKTKLTIANEDREKVAVENIEEIRLANQGTSLGEHLEKMLFGETGHDIYFDAGKKWMSAYKRIPNTNWIAACSIPFSDFQSKLTGIAVSMIVIFIVMTIISLFTCGFIINISIKPLRQLKSAISNIATGNADLTKRLSVKSEDEIGAVVKSFNDFTEKLHTIISQVKDSKENLSIAGKQMNDITLDTGDAISTIISNINSVNEQIINQSASVDQTAGAVNEIASNIYSLEKMIENQSAGVSQASAAVEEMIGNIGSVNLSVEKMASSFEELEKNAQMGSNKQQDVNERIEQIKGQSEMLQDANTAIASIAEQTNLLAMNAAIEAAHAGEAGKGFSVVADEIRKLSETSGEQSKTIGVQLDKIRHSIDDVVKASAESSDAFLLVSGKIHETDELVRQIKSAMEEQQEGSRQIGEALHAMNDSTIEVRNASCEMSTGNKSILLEVQNLQSATATMKDSVNEMSSGANRIDEKGASLSDVSSVMGKSIEKIGDEIDLFKV